MANWTHTSGTRYEFHIRLNLHALLEVQQYSPRYETLYLKYDTELEAKKDWEKLRMKYPDAKISKISRAPWTQSVLQR